MKKLIRFNKSSRTISIISGILATTALYSSFTSADERIKNFALNLGILTAGIGLTSEVIAATTRDGVLTQVEELKHKLDTEIEKKDSRIQHLINETATQKASLIEYQKAVNELATQLKAKDAAIEILKASTDNKIKELDAKLAQDDTRQEELIAALKTEFWQLCCERIDIDYNRMGEVVEKKLNDEQFKNIREQLESFYTLLHESHVRHCEELKEIQSLELEGIAKNLTDIYFGISSQTATLKVKLRNLLHLDERLALDEALEELIQRRDPSQFVSVEKARHLLDIQAKGDLADIKKLENSFSMNLADFDELKAQVADLLNEIDHKNLEIQQLKDEVRKLKLPRFFYGGSNIAQVGSRITQYYYERYNIKLDGINWQETETGYSLLFSIRNNPGVTIDELYADNSREQLAAFTNALHGTLPEFDFNYQHCLLTLTVVLRKPVKKDTSKEEIDKLWTPVSKFEKTVAKWERIRITAGSTGGKSPTAKNLALAIMKARNGQGEIKLYDPQHGPKKDYWDMPKAGTSHADNVKGMEELCRELDRRSETPGSSPFVLYIFDEIDSTIAQERGNNDYYYFKDKVTYSLKQASHQNIGAIYIGQACDASTIPGMSWSDWNNAVQLHIGANAGIWLDKAKTITNEEKSKLLEKYRKIQEYCERKNEELGLDIFTDAGAYRFALAVPLSGLPQFIQLPAFDSYDYQEVMGKQEQLPVVHFTEIKQETKTELSCPHCGSLNIYKKGTNRKKEQLYECKDCSKTPKRFIPNTISKKIEE